MATAGPSTAREGALGGEVDMDYPRIIKQHLQRSLSRVSSTGSFATCNPCLNASNPGLFVKGIGLISLPLSEQGAGSIIQASLNYPVKDFTIDAAWTIKELDSEHFELQNPAWHQTLQGIIDQITPHAAAGVSVIKAEPYKLLLYPQGARSKPHEQYFVGQPGTRSCDLGREPLVFGTLEICLPSKHEGGFLQITNEGETETLDSAKNSESGYSFMAWYAKVTHEVRLVTSGYRFTLIYNLIYTGSGAPLFTAVPDGEKKDLRRAFSLWREGLSRNEKATPSKLIYVLDRNYSNENLGVEALVGSDRVKALCLQEVCIEADFYLYLGNLERTVRGGCDEDEYDAYGYGSGFGGSAYFVNSLGGSRGDESGKTYHEITDICTETNELKYIVGPNGPKTPASIRIGEHDVIQPEQFTNGPDKEDYSVATQDGGATAIHYYHRTVVVLMPRYHCTDFLFGIVKDGWLEVTPWIEGLIRDTNHYPYDRRHKDDLIRLCQLIIEMNKAFLEKNHPGQYSKSEWESKNSQYSEDVIGGVVRASLMLKRLDLFEEALAVVPQGLSPWVYVAIGRAIHSIGFAEIKDPLDKAAPSLSRIYERYNALDDILYGYEVARSQGGRDDDLADLEEWAKGKIEESFDRGPAFMKDGSALVRITDKYGDKFFFKRVLPFVKANASNIGFIIAFATKLFEASEKGVVASNVVTNVLRDILSDLIPEFTLRCDSETAAKRQWTDAECQSQIDDGPEPTQHPEQPFVHNISGKSIAQLLGHCISLNLDQEIPQILLKLTSESQTAHPSALRSTFLPFLTSLLTTILPTHKIPPTDPRYRSFIQELISTYITRYICLEPRNWVRPLYGCGSCNDCEKLNCFLLDQEFNTISFAMAQKRRDHIEGQLKNSRVLSVETVRLSSPYTLVVKKVEDEAEAKWRERCEEAEKWFRELGTEEQVKEMLGSRYEELVGLKAVRLARAPASWTVELGRKIRYSCEV